MRLIGRVPDPHARVLVAATLLVAILLTVWGMSSGSATGRRPSDAGAGTGPPPSAQPGPASRDQASPEIFRVYLAPDGSDGNSGLHVNEPVRTLRQAQKVLLAARPAVDVEVRIRRGTYVAPPMEWSFAVPGHTVSFMPTDYRMGASLDDIAGRPVFRGDGTSGFWFTATLPDGYPGKAGLRFYYLRVERYDRGGLLLHGGTTVVDGRLRPAGDGYNGNVVQGMYFTEIGSRWTGKRSGYAGVDLVNSRDNDILYNHFVKLENRGDNASLIHGVYLAHGSDDNRIRGNKFETISGDPVRTRNASNDNDIFGNTLRGTGSSAHFSDWFCDRRCASSNKQPGECASHGNLFHDNTTSTGYGGRGVADWKVLSANSQHSACDSNRSKRLRTWDNR